MLPCEREGRDTMEYSRAGYTNNYWQHCLQCTYRTALIAYGYRLFCKQMPSLWISIMRSKDKMEYIKGRCYLSLCCVPVHQLTKWSKWQTSGSGTTSLAWTYMKVCGYIDLFCKNLKQKSLTPRWPLTPHLLRSHVWLYPRIIVSKSHENTSKYVDTVTLLAKTWTKGQWP